MLANAAEEDGHRGTVPACAHWDPAGQDRTGQDRVFPSIPSPSPFPAHTVLLQAVATEEGGAPQTQVLAPQLCEGLATGLEAVRQGRPAQPQPPPGESSWAGWPAAWATPEKSCCKKDMKPHHCESGR